MGDFQANGVAKALAPYMDSAPTHNVVPFRRSELRSESGHKKMAAAFAHLPLE